MAEMTPAQQAKADAADAKATEDAPKPDPKLVPGLTLDTLTQLASLVESLAGMVPMAHSLAVRVGKMQASLAATVFHASPPA